MTSSIPKPNQIPLPETADPSSQSQLTRDEEVDELKRQVAELRKLAAMRAAGKPVSTYKQLNIIVSMFIDRIPMLKGLKTKGLMTIKAALLVGLTQVNQYYKELGFPTDLHLYEWMNANVEWIMAAAAVLLWLGFRAKDAHLYREK